MIKAPSRNTILDLPQKKQYFFEKKHRRNIVNIPQFNDLFAYSVYDSENKINLEPEERVMLSTLSLIVSLFVCFFSHSFFEV